MNPYVKLRPLQPLSSKLVEKSVLKVTIPLKPKQEGLFNDVYWDNQHGWVQDFVYVLDRGSNYPGAVKSRLLEEKTMHVVSYGDVEVIGNAKPGDQILADNREIYVCVTPTLAKPLHQSAQQDIIKEPSEGRIVDYHPV